MEISAALQNALPVIVSLILLAFFVLNMSCVLSASSRVGANSMLECRHNVSSRLNFDGHVFHLFQSAYSCIRYPVDILAPNMTRSTLADAISTFLCEISAILPRLLSRIKI